MTKVSATNNPLPLPKPGETQFIARMEKVIDRTWCISQTVNKESAEKKNRKGKLNQKQTAQ